MSEKKSAPPPPKPKAPPPAKGTSAFPTLLSAIVALIATACITASVLSVKEPELHTTQATTEEPFLQTTTEEQITQTTTEEQITQTTTEEYTTQVTTEESTTQATTEEPTTQATTEEPTTQATTEEQPVSEESLLILVNKEHPLPEDYQADLVPLTDWFMDIAKVAHDDLQAMLCDAMAEGYSLIVSGAHRSAAEQQALFDGMVDFYLQQGKSQELAELDAFMHEQDPKHSEHLTGLAVDIVSESYQQKDESQGTTEETKWLHEHCHEYGFIVRYPLGKVSETGIPYKPWHYRYVGKEAAKLITEQNLTLESYWNLYGDS